MERGEITHHAFILVLLVSVDSLCVLTKVVKTRKLLAAVAAKRAFTRMFPSRKRNQKEEDFFKRRLGAPDVTSKVLAPGKNHATLAIAPALEGLCWSRAITLGTRLWGLLLKGLWIVGYDGGHVFWQLWRMFHEG